MSLRPTVSGCAIAALLGLLATPAAFAVADPKAYGAAGCEPYAPDTTRAELAYSPNGIYNPGTTSEKVMCLLVRDQDLVADTYLLAVTVHYRVLGATPARMTCTLWIGSTSQAGVTQASDTKSGAMVNAGAHSSVAFEVYQSDAASIHTSTSLLCVIPPKTSFGSIVQAEEGYFAP